MGSKNGCKVRKYNWSSYSMTINYLHKDNRAYEGLKGPGKIQVGPQNDISGPIKD